MIKKSVKKNPALIPAIQHALRAHASAEKAAFFPRFFKTGKGEYGEGDQFLGVTVPDQRKVANEFSTIDLSTIEKLLYSPIHEERLVSLLILVDQYAKGDAKTKQMLFDFYLKHAKQVNNWDLVDLSAYKIVGSHLHGKEKDVLYRLVKSKNLWERRIAIVSTYHFIRNGEFEETFAITEKLLGDSHDLIHKACGWMLREVGKRDVKALEGFLKKHARAMPRTMLRYAIEKFPRKRRAAYLAGNA